MSGRLDGKVAIITGGATGIGEAICQKFVRNGAKVVVNGLPADPVEDVVAALTAGGGQAVAFVGDVADERHAAACVQTAIDAFGKLDVLVNNAGINLVIAQAHDYPVDAFDRIVRANVRSAFLMTRFALPHLHKTHGNVVFNGSEAGFNGTPTITPYGGTKGFLHAYMMGVAVEQAKNGVRANCVCPGPIDTAWTHKETAPMDEKVEVGLLGATPLARRGTPEEVANVFAFVASDEASFVTGAMYLVDGGITPAKGLAGADTPAALRVQPQGVLSVRHSLDGNNGKRVVRLQ